jgi:hypothetical protein
MVLAIDEAISRQSASVSDLQSLKNKIKPLTSLIRTTQSIEILVAIAMSTARLTSELFAS